MRGGQGRDVFPTKDDVALAVVRALHARLAASPKRVLEPSVGGGSLARATRAFYPRAHITGIDVTITEAAIEACDAWQQQDFLTYSPLSRDFDLCVSNPPYRDAQAHVEHMLTIAPHATVAALLRLGFLAGQARRATIWTTNPPDEVLVFSKRPSFTGDGKTDATEYALFVWWRGRGGSHTAATRIGWL